MCRVALCSFAKGFWYIAVGGAVGRLEGQRHRAERESIQKIALNHNNVKPARPALVF